MCVGGERPTLLVGGGDGSAACHAAALRCCGRSTLCHQHSCSKLWDLYPPAVGEPEYVVADQVLAARLLR